MSKDNLDEMILEIEKIKAIGRKNTKIILFQALIFISVGIALAYLFRHLHTEEHYIKTLGLLSQIIAFSAAIILSDQFLSIPEKYSGVHDHLVAAVMSAPIHLWLGSFLYTLGTIFFAVPNSEVWNQVITIVCFGIGLVIFAAGSIGEAFSVKVKDKSAAVAVAWYMIIFTLGLQIYVSLIELEIINLNIV
ncbi:MAG: hypothetical protein ACJAS1_006161 [Oleiphilaceae bacterium]|jgi:hypothetical protein